MFLLWACGTCTCPCGKLTRPLSVRCHPAPPPHAGLASPSHQATIVLAACVQYGHGRVGCHRGTPAEQHSHTPLYIRALGVLRPNANSLPVGAKLFSQNESLKTCCRKLFSCSIAIDKPPKKKGAIICCAAEVQQNCPPPFSSVGFAILPWRYAGGGGGGGGPLNRLAARTHVQKTASSKAAAAAAPKQPAVLGEEGSTNPRVRTRRRRRKEPKVVFRRRTRKEMGNGRKKGGGGRGRTSPATSLARSMPLHEGGRRRRAFYIGCSRHEGSLN